MFMHGSNWPSRLSSQRLVFRCVSPQEPHILHIFILQLHIMCFWKLYMMCYCLKHTYSTAYLTGLVPESQSQVEETGTLWEDPRGPEPLCYIWYLSSPSSWHIPGGPLKVENDIFYFYTFVIEYWWLLDFHVHDIVFQLGMNCCAICNFPYDINYSYATIQQSLLALQYNGDCREKIPSNSYILNTFLALIIHKITHLNSMLGTAG